MNEKEPDRRPTVSINQAAKLTGVSRRTVYNWMLRGLIEWRRTPSGSPRIFEDTLWRKGWTSDDDKA